MTFSVFKQNSYWEFLRTQNLALSCYPKPIIFFVKLRVSSGIGGGVPLPSPLGLPTSCSRPAAQALRRHRRAPLQVHIQIAAASWRRDWSSNVSSYPIRDSCMARSLGDAFQCVMASWGEKSHHSPVWRVTGPLTFRFKFPKPKHVRSESPDILGAVVHTGRCAIKVYSNNLPF